MNSKKVLTIGTENDLGLDFGETTSEAFIDLLKEDYSKDSMLQTGIPSWDRALGGGFVKKNVHLIGACPGGGKSKTMAGLAKHAIELGKRVIFITLELSETETQANINCAITGLNMYQMLDPINREEFDRKIHVFKNTYNPQCVVKFYKPGAILQILSIILSKKLFRKKKMT